MKPYDHAVASAKLFGGIYEDYIEIHKWFDQFRSSIGDPRHRLFLHNTTGVLICEQVFGDCITLSDGKTLATRDVAEHHIMVDVGEMRTPQDWLDNIDDVDWVKPNASKLEKLINKAKKTSEDATPKVDEKNLVPLDELNKKEIKKLTKKVKKSFRGRNSGYNTFD